MYSEILEVLLITAASANGKKFAMKALRANGNSYSQQQAARGKRVSLPGILYCSQINRIHYRVENDARILPDMLQCACFMLFANVCVHDISLTFVDGTGSRVHRHQFLEVSVRPCSDLHERIMPACNIVCPTGMKVTDI